MPGPKIRFGTIEGETVELVAGQAFTLTTQEVTGGPTRASVNFPQLVRVVKPCDSLFVNDGLVHVEVEGVAGSDVRCRVVVGGPSFGPTPAISAHPVAHGPLSGIPRAPAQGC